MANGTVGLVADALKRYHSLFLPQNEEKKEKNIEKNMNNFLQEKKISIFAKIYKSIQKTIKTNV